MVSIALIGPDGAGKTTIGRRLQDTLQLPVKYLYMGVNLDASNHMLPTTRLVRWVKRVCGAKPDTAGPPDPNRIRQRPKGLVKRTVKSLKAAIRLVHRVTEEWFRQLLAWQYQRRGNVVLFDRHYYTDYYAYDIATNNGWRPLSRRIHGFLLERVYPKPDLVIYLDAPAEVLFARKREGTIEALERRRQDYLQMKDLLPQFMTVDATQPEDEVVREVTRMIWDVYQKKTGKSVLIEHVPR